VGEKISKFSLEEQKKRNSGQLLNGTIVWEDEKD